MLGLALYEAGVCNCGIHSSLTADKSNVFTFDERTCPVCIGAAKWARVRAAEDERALKALGENPPPVMQRPGDGRTTYTRQMSPLEVAARREGRSGTAAHSTPADSLGASDPHPRRTPQVGI